MFNKTLSFLFVFCTLPFAQALEGLDLSQLGHATEFTCLVSIEETGTSYSPEFTVTQYCDPLADKEVVGVIPVYRGMKRLDNEQVQLQVIKGMRDNYDFKSVSKDSNGVTTLVFQKK